MTGELRAQGLKVEKYIVKRSYRGNAFDLIDMIGFDTYPFFIKYQDEIDSSLAAQELKMRQQDAKTKQMTKFIDGGEAEIYMPPIITI